MSQNTLNASSLNRRAVLGAGAAAGAALTVASSAQAAAPPKPARVTASEHWTTKKGEQGDVKLYLYRKQLAGTPAKPRPILFLVHGSTFSSRGSYDLMVPGRTGFSAMEHFARLGYDVWTMDHESYGFSQRTNSNSGIQAGVVDLQAALPVIEKVTGQSSVMMFGESSGAIRAGAFAMAEPKRVSRLILHAFTYTGKDAPEIARRRGLAEQFRANPRRPFGAAQIENVFNRDVKGATDPAIIKAIGDYELKFGDSVPSGTYLDMAVNMPMVDPAKVTCPVLMIRPEHDGNESEAELFRFFRELASTDKQFIKVHGLPHGGGMVGSQRERLWHIIQGFLTFPLVA
jgi:alpha-beta hydrolase superfamily lysophospholipase